MTLRPLELRLDVAIALHLLVVCVEFRGDWEWVLIRYPFPLKAVNENLFPWKCAQFPFTLRLFPISSHSHSHFHFVIYSHFYGIPMEIPILVPVVISGYDMDVDSVVVCGADSKLELSRCVHH